VVVVTADQRVTDARAYMATADQCQTDVMTRAALIVMRAELLRHLAAVLAAVTEMEFTIADAESAEDDRAATHIDEDGVWFIPADARTVTTALHIAAWWAGKYGNGEDGTRYSALARILEDGTK
jgi:hypothetical protein